MRTVAAALALSLLASPAWGAGPYDPALQWHTIYSPRFAVHYPDGARNLGVRISRIAESSLDDVGELFGYVPNGRIEIILSDASDLANGSAQVSPKNTIRVFLSAPTELTGLSSYEDWIRILLIHEIAHICDIDQTWGFTRFLRGIFGKYVQWNGFAPQFLTEGVAVYAETVLSETGRGRSSYVAMLLRTAALEERFLDIDQAHIFYSDWPGGNAPYFYGGRFHLWLADQFGQDAVRELHNYNAAFPLPYIYYFGAEEIFGDSLPDLWAQWRDEETALAEEIAFHVRAAGETQSERLTFHGRNITGTRYHPSGQWIIYSRSSPKDGSTVRRVSRDGSGDEHLVLQTFSPRFSFTPGGDGFVYSQAAINERFNNFNDLYRYDLESGDTAKLSDVDRPSESLRARDPDVSPDGNRVVFVQNRLHQSWLSVGRFVDDSREKMKVRTLIPPSGDMQQASPRFAPEGERIAVSTWFDGGKRDVIIIDSVSGALLRRVTFDRALDGNPAWTPDGRFLLYESDADGISNIYAYDTREGGYYRVTRVVGGAFQADVAKDGSAMLFRNASGVGFDIHEMPFDPGSWIPVTYDPDRGYIEGPRRSAQAEPWARTGLGVRAQPRQDEPPTSLRGGEGEAEYNPWRTLLPLQDNWVLLPSIVFVNQDPTVTLATVGNDALGEHSYVLTAGTSWFTQRFNWSAAYFNDVWYPTFSLSYADRWTSFPTSTDPVIERRRSATAGMSLPVRQRHHALVSYTFGQRNAADERSADILDLFGDERFAFAQLGYRYAYVRQYPHSVGREDGGTVALTGRWYATALGADFDEVMVSLDGRLYINNPVWDNHVIALRLAAALAFGPDYEELFALGGEGSSSLFTVQTEQVYPLRGFPLDFELYPPGTGLLAGYLEYRMPLWHVERGVWTVPFYIERLSLAFFVDAGSTFGDEDDADLGEVFRDAGRQLERLRLGAGGEIRLDVNLGWGFPLTVRGGAAYPVLDRGSVGARAPQFYFNLGGGL